MGKLTKVNLSEMNENIFIHFCLVIGFPHVLIAFVWDVFLDDLRAQ